VSDRYNPHTTALRKSLRDTESSIQYLKQTVLKNDDLPDELRDATNPIIEKKIQFCWGLCEAIGDEIRRLEDPSNPINYIEQEMPAAYRYYDVANRNGPVSVDHCNDDLGLVEDSAIELLATDIHRMRQSDFDRMSEVAEALAEHGCTKLLGVVKSEGVLEQIAANEAARIAEKFS
jgi:hypothetical protein